MTDGPRYPEGLEDLPTPDELRAMTGREFVEGMLSGRVVAATIYRPMNFRLVEVGDGTATFRGVPTFEHYNPLGTVHGGWYGTVLDSALGCSIHTRLPAGRTYTTLEYKVNLLRAARQDTGALLCIGRAIHVGRSTATSEARIVGEADGKLYATGTTTCMIFDIG